MSGHVGPTVPHDEAASVWDPAVRHGSKGVVATDSRVLLVKERHADGQPFWTLPGGGLHSEEPPAGALKRELDEELGCAAVVTDPISVFWYAHRRQPPLSRYTIFECAILSDARPASSEGVLEAKWVDPADPPAETLLQVRYILRFEEY